MEKMFETNFRFHVRKHTVEKVSTAFFRNLMLVLTKFSFWDETLDIRLGHYDLANVSEFSKIVSL